MRLSRTINVQGVTLRPIAGQTEIFDVFVAHQQISIRTRLAQTSIMNLQTFLGEKVEKEKDK